MSRHGHTFKENLDCAFSVTFLGTFPGTDDSQSHIDLPWGKRFLLFLRPLRWFSSGENWTLVTIVHHKPDCLRLSESMPTLRAYALTFPGASGPPLAACPVGRLDSHSLDTPKHPCSFMHLSNTKYWHISGYLILFSSQAVGGKFIVVYKHSGIHHCSQKLQCYLLFLEAKLIANIAKNHPPDMIILQHLHFRFRCLYFFYWSLALECAKGMMNWYIE